MAPGASTLSSALLKLSLHFNSPSSFTAMSVETINGDSARSTRWKVFCKKEGELTEINFADCILDVLNIKEDLSRIQLHITPDRLTFSNESSDADNVVPSPLEESYSATLRHSSRCPLRELRLKDIGLISSETLKRGIAVAVATLVQTSDNFILLTKRSSHMRTFPGCWVPPGGHVEAGESLKFAAKREMKEETGLDLDIGGNSTTVTGIWESIYPPVLEWGIPIRHHIVIYFLYKAKDDHETLQKQLKIDPVEVSTCVWLTPSQISIILSNDKTQISQFANDACPVSLAPSTSNEQRTCQLPIKDLFNFEGFSEGRITVGTVYALEEWCKQLGTKTTGPAHVDYSSLPTLTVSPRL